MGIAVEVESDVEVCDLSYSDLSPGELIKYDGLYFVVLPENTGQSEIAVCLQNETILYEDASEHCVRMDGTLKVPQ